jgi:hypothetical protein
MGKALEILWATSALSTNGRKKSANDIGQPPSYFTATD